MLHVVRAAQEAIKEYKLKIGYVVLLEEKSRILPPIPSHNVVTRC